MEEKKIGLSRDLIIHPGEDLLDELNERHMSQLELAIATGFSEAYISNVIAGKKGITTRFAKSLEYALGIPSYLWLRLQARYESELLEYEENQSLQHEEKDIVKELGELVQYLMENHLIEPTKNSEELILELRRKLCMSNLSNLKEWTSIGRYQGNTSDMDQQVLGGWIRMCQLLLPHHEVKNRFHAKDIDEIIMNLSSMMHKTTMQSLMGYLAKYGIELVIAPRFESCFVRGYICRNGIGVFQIYITENDISHDEFWRTLVHELGHLKLGHVGRTGKYLDLDMVQRQEKEVSVFVNDWCLQNVK